MTVLVTMVSGALLICAVAGGWVAFLATKVIGDMASDEVRGWLDVAPRAILRIASARLSREQRHQLYEEEWLPELHAIMREAETRPITRAIRAISFALGLLMAARAIARLRPPTPQPAVEDGQTATVKGIASVEIKKFKINASGFSINRKGLSFTPDGVSVTSFPDQPGEN